MRLIPIPASELDKWIPGIGWHLRSFCRSGQMTPEEIIADLRTENRQLWIVLDSRIRAAVLTLVLKDELNTVQITHCAGDGYREWFPLISIIEQWAREIGGKSFEVIARPGWEPLLKDHGLRKTHVVMEKRL